MNTIVIRTQQMRKLQLEETEYIEQDNKCQP